MLMLFDVDVDVTFGRFDDSDVCHVSYPAA